MRYVIHFCLRLFCASKQKGKTKLRYTCGFRHLSTPLGRITLIKAAIAKKSCYIRTILRKVSSSSLSLLTLSSPFHIPLYPSQWSLEMTTIDEVLSTRSEIGIGCRHKQMDEMYLAYRSQATTEPPDNVVIDLLKTSPLGQAGVQLVWMLQNRSQSRDVPALYPSSLLSAIPPRVYFG